MRAKKIVSLFMVVAGVLSLFLSGCTAKQKTEEIPPCDIPMQTIEQQSLNHYANFKFSVPEGWLSEETGKLSIASASSEIRQVNVDNPEAWTLYIKNYQYSNWGQEYSEEYIKAYHNLFRGETALYKTTLNTAVSRILQSSDSTLSSDSDLLDIFNFIASAYEESNSTPASEGSQYITALNCQLYSGKNGKIAVVKYTISVEEHNYFMIDCIREDIPYLISGCFDDTLEISSGDIALWTANSLEVDENFIVKENKIQKK